MILRFDLHSIFKPFNQISVNYAEKKLVEKGKKGASFSKNLHKFCKKIARKI